MLVHCVGGVSRSSTVVIAYLMLKNGYSLNEAYDVVKAKKSNISPNFNFMQQLLDFERAGPSSQTPTGRSEVSISNPSSFESEISDLSNKSCWFSMKSFDYQPVFLAISLYVYYWLDYELDLISRIYCIRCTYVQI